jgi:biopolymer transport protein ExbD
MDITRHDKAHRQKISLTPLIDVVFILLMFFMLTTSFTHQRQLELAAPVASALPEAPPPQRILVAANGDASLYGDGEVLSDSRLQELLASDSPVVVMPDPEANVQTLVGTMTRLKNLGMAQISLGKPYPSATGGQNNHVP